MVYFPDNIRKGPAREGNKEGATRQFGPGIGIGAGVIREGNWSVAGSRRIKTDLESLLKNCRNIGSIHANISPRFQ